MYNVLITPTGSIFIAHHTVDFPKTIYFVVAKMLAFDDAQNFALDIISYRICKAAFSETPSDQRDILQKFVIVVDRGSCIAFEATPYEVAKKEILLKLGKISDNVKSIVDDINAYESSFQK